MLGRLLGERWERRAETFLRRRGLTSRVRNYHCRWGEIDLIMDDDEVLVFVEVRLRSRGDFGSGGDSVNPAKQQKLIRAAGAFLAAHPALAHRPCRFDVVAADGQQMEWIRNAFDLG